jgi:hypothetical protein
MTEEETQVRARVEEGQRESGKGKSRDARRAGTVEVNADGTEVRLDLSLDTNGVGTMWREEW